MRQVIKNFILLKEGATRDTANKGEISRNNVYGRIHNEFKNLLTILSLLLQHYLFSI